MSPALRMCKRFLIAVFASPFSNLGNLGIYKRPGPLNLVHDPTRKSCLGVSTRPAGRKATACRRSSACRKGTTAVAPNVNVLVRPCEVRNPRGEMAATTLSVSARSCFSLLPLGISLSAGPPLILLCTGSIPLSNHGAVTMDVGGSELSGLRHPSVLAQHRVIVISPLLLNY